MRIVVIGKQGQVATAIRERAKYSGLDVFSLGRPAIDLLDPDTVKIAIRSIKPEIVINTAAFTAVDLAESEPELAQKTNASGAAIVAAVTAAMGIPLIHLSTDYVFDGQLDWPYRETDQTNPLGHYGTSKLAGEVSVAQINPDHAILRTSWVYSPFGKNFVRTMLTLAGTREEISVVGDQLGNPTSAHDIADGALTVAENLLQSPTKSDLRGIFHMTGKGETTWANFAEAIFEFSGQSGGPRARVVAIPTSAYPTAARRPKNSRLDNEKLARCHGVVLPDWLTSLKPCIDRLLSEEFRWRKRI